MFRACESGLDPWPPGLLANGRSAACGPYRLLEVIGRGASASVYRALGADGRHVAIKVLRAHPAGDRAAGEAALAREAGLLTAMRHPNIVDYLDEGEIAGRPFIVLELLEGGSLARHAQSSATRDLHDVAALLAGPADALAMLHRAGFVHGDVKAKNIVIADDGATKLVDFGDARPLDGVDRSTACGRVLFEAADPRHDVHGFAATVLTLLGWPQDRARSCMLDPRPTRAPLEWLRRARSADIGKRPGDPREWVSLVRAMKREEPRIPFYRRSMARC